MRQMILDSSDSISQIMSRLQRLRVSTISMSISMHVVRGLAILIFFLNSRGHVNAYLGVGYKLKKMTRQVIPLPPTPYHAPMISLLLSGPAMFKFACAVCMWSVCVRSARAFGYRRLRACRACTERTEAHRHSRRPKKNTNTNACVRTEHGSAKTRGVPAEPPSLSLSLSPAAPACQQTTTRARANAPQQTDEAKEQPSAFRKAT